MHTGESEIEVSASPKGPGVRLAVLHELADGAKLRTNRIFEINETGITFAGDLTLDQWIELLKTWRRAGTMFHCGLADLFGYGREKFGEEQVNTALSQLEFDMHDVNRALAIASMESDVRHPALTAEHYWVLARKEFNLNPGGQKKWSELAVEHKLTPRALASSIFAGKIITGRTGAGAGGGRGIATPQGVRHAFDMWYRQVEESEPIEQWDEARQREVWAQLEAPTMVGIALAHRLGIALGQQAVSDVSDAFPAIDEEMIQKAADCVKKEGKASVVMLQRRFRLGYVRASNLMEILQKRGLVGEAQGIMPKVEAA